MKPKSLAILALLTLALVVAATLSLRSREAAHARTEVEELLLPDLAARVNDVTEVTVEKAGQKATLVRAGDAWTCTEASGYPADFNKVRSTLVSLARLKVVEPMTKDPASHGKLGVDAATGARVVLKDASGTVAADLIVGETVYARNGQRVYARRADSDQAYLCEGDLALSGDPLTWVQRDIVKIDASRMSRIEITHADGEAVKASKALPASPNWDVEDVPAERPLKTTGIANSLGTALSYLSLDAVKPASELPLGESHAATASYRTFDGLVVDVRVARVEEANWLTFDVRFEEPEGPVGPVAPPTDVAGAPPGRGRPSRRPGRGRGRPGRACGHAGRPGGGRRGKDGGAAQGGGRPPAAARGLGVPGAAVQGGPVPAAHDGPAGGAGPAPRGGPSCGPRGGRAARRRASPASPAGRGPRGRRLTGRLRAAGEVAPTARATVW